VKADNSGLVVWGINKIVKPNHILAIITITQLVIGMLTQLYIIKIFGFGENTDSFIAAQTAPVILSAIMIVSFQSVYLPSLSIKVNNERKWIVEQSKAHSKLAILFFCISIVLTLSSMYWVSFIFGGFNDTQIHNTQTLLIFLLLVHWLKTHNHIFVISLRTKNKFIIADCIVLAGTALNYLLIYLFVNPDTLIALGYTYLLSSLMVFLILYFLSGKPILIFKNIFKNNKNWRLMIPLCKGNTLYKTSPLVDSYWLSQSFSGAISLYSLAQTINSAVIKVLDKLVVVMYLPRIAVLARDKNIAEIKNIYKAVTLKVLFLSIVFIVLIFSIEFCWHDIISYGFEISRENSRILWLVIISLIFVLFSSLVGTIITNIFYAFGDTKTPTKIGIYGFLCSIPLRGLGFIYGGIVGLAIMNSVYYLGNLSALHIKLKQKLE
jgi:putative peptidoglycan lipid II flippase